MDWLSAFLNDFWNTVKTNLAVVVALASAMVTGTIGLRMKSLEARSEDKKTDVDVSRIEFERELATDQKFDRLVAHLERQLEVMDKKLDRANEMNDRQAEEIGWLKSKMIVMDAHIGRLTAMIISLGATPPDRPPDPPRSA